MNNSIRGKRVCFWVCLLSLCISGLWAETALGTVVEAIRVSDYSQYSHVIIETSGLDTCTVRPVTSSSPYIEVLLRDVTYGDIGTYCPVRSEAVGNISLSQDGTGRWLIIKIPLSPKVNANQIHWHVWKDFVTIDLPLKLVNPKAAPTQQQIAAHRSKGGKVVILDPGHGGFHTGTTGGHYTRLPKQEEKTIVLDMANRIKKLMDKNPNLLCILTRTGDYLPVPYGVEGTSRTSYISESLKYRVELAKQYQGDIYISLHLNATDGNQRDARGYEIWYMGDESADTVYNSNTDLDQLETIGVDRSNKDSMILSALKRDVVPQGSALLAHAITDQIGKVPGVVFRPKTIVSTNKLRVVKQFNMPSVLVEFLFLTHPVEHEYIRSIRNRDLLCQAVYNGVKAYFNFPENPALQLARNTTTRQLSIPADNTNLAKDSSSEFLPQSANSGVAYSSRLSNRLSSRLRELDQNRPGLNPEQTIERPLSQATVQTQTNEYPLSDQSVTGTNISLESDSEISGTPLPSESTGAIASLPPIYTTPAQPKFDDDPLIIIDDLDQEARSNGDPMGNLIRKTEQEAKNQNPGLPIANVTARSEPEETGPKLIDHRIQRKETLATIARKYGTTIEELKRLNYKYIGKSNVIQVGKVLKVPNSEVSQPMETDNTEPTLQKPSITQSTNTVPVSTEEDRPVTYTVKNGDSLDSIASKFKTTPAALRKLNNLKKTVIHPGDKLKVTSGGQMVDKPKSKTPSKVADAKPIQYQVKKGDNLSDIANRFNVTVKSIKVLNGMSSSRLDVGKTLRIPR